MKRLLLAALLSVVAAALAPGASASAAETVECKFKGSATFEPESLGLTPKEDGFTFKTETGASKCNGEAASAELKGKGKLSCTVSPGLGVGGLASSSGTLTAKGETFNVNFEFVGAGPTVTFKAEGEDTTTHKKFKGSGVANFSETGRAVTECEKGALGSVKFEATAAGVVE